MGWRLAIDFGTSNTTAAVWLDGAPAPSVVRLDDSSDQMPSAVLVGDDQVWVGTGAEREARVQPGRYLANPKAYLGEAAWQFGPRSVPLPRLVAYVLERAYARAKVYAGGTDPEHVVLTHPEQWRGHRIAQLREAARLAGLGEVALVSEPVAAASAYAAGARGPAVVAVGDLGGGTCDIAVLRRGDGPTPAGTYEVLASDGEHIGGDQLDAALVALAVRELEASGHDDTATHLRQERRTPGAPRAQLLNLRRDVREAKHQLAEYPHASVRAGSATVTINDRQLADEAEPMVERFLDLNRRVMAEAGVTPDELDAYYLTGGSSRLRIVAARVGELLGRPPQLKLDPKTVTVLGALHWWEASTGSLEATTVRPSGSRVPPVPTRPERGDLSQPLSPPPLPDSLFRTSSPNVPEPTAATEVVAGLDGPAELVDAEPVADEPVAEPSPEAPERPRRRRWVRGCGWVAALLVLAVVGALAVFTWNEYGRHMLPSEEPAPPVQSSAPPSPTPSGPAPQLVAFQTPSGNIRCAFRSRTGFGDDTDLVCTVQANEWNAASSPPMGCPPEQWGQSVRLGPRGGPAMVCTDPIGADAKQVGYGTTHSRGPITCDVMRSGVSCTNADKRRLFVARERWGAS